MPRSSPATTREPLPRLLVILLVAGGFALVPSRAHDWFATIVSAPILVLVLVWGLVFYFHVIVAISKELIGYVFTVVLAFVEFYRLFVYPMACGVKQNDNTTDERTVS